MSTEPLLPSAVVLARMDYVYHGQPFVEVAAKRSVELQTMDYAYLAQPFVGGAR